MFQKIINWIKTHKLTTFLLLVIGYFVVRSFSLQMLGISGSQYKYSTGMDKSFSVNTMMGIAESPADSYAPSAEVYYQQQRKVVTNSSFSLLVKSVNQTLTSINDKLRSINGFMVNTQINRGQNGDTAYLSVRIPTNQIDEFSAYLRTLAVKVSYENMSGNDITDQYTDYVTRIATLETRKAQMESFASKAVKVDDLLSIQNSINNIQEQIDRLRGQLKYMDQSSSTSLVSITISTDELSLPYAPVKSWRPALIFKEAVRSMLSLLQTVGTWLIWLAVFAPIIIILGVIVFIVVRKRRNRVVQVK